jgi:hypothetical protein
MQSMFHLTPKSVFWERTTTNFGYKEQRVLRHAREAPIAPGLWGTSLKEARAEAIWRIGIRRMPGLTPFSVHIMLARCKINRGRDLGQFAWQGNPVMQLIAPDLLIELKEISQPVLLLGFCVGMLLWATGWLGHRFWIVLVATTSAGVMGLLTAPASRGQPVVGALLLAIAAGVLALALVRVVAFVAGGVAAWIAMHSLAPAGWDEPLLCFVAGGLFGLLLFRVWTMALTSFGGALLMMYFGLSLAHTYGKLDAVAIAEQNPGLVNWTCWGFTILGVIAQFVMDRSRARRLRMRQEEELSLAGRWQHGYDFRRWWGFGRTWYRRTG